METVNGVMDGDKGGPPPPSPLTGCYLLIVVGEPYSEQHKDIILQRIAKGLLSWNITECMVDLEKELAIITEQALEGEEARYGERLIQFASENLVTEILIHPVVSTLAQCMRNLLSSFTRHRHIIHAGYTFAANGSWALQDGTFSLSDFSEAFQELEVQRVIHAYENGITLDLHCSPEGDWTRLPKEPFAKACKVRVNPTDVLTSGSPAITNFTNYIAPFLVSTALENILESSDVVGNIRFSRPTLYVFPGGQGDAALFGINGFNMLLDGGFSRKSCFWDFVRHLDRLDAVLMTRLNNSNVGGISSVLRRKKQDAVYPQLGHFFCNLQERKALPSPDGDKDKDPLLINLLDEGQEIISNLRHLNLNPQVCYRDSEPINLYHKVGHGTLDMYVLSPAKDSKEVREFLLKWNQSDQKLFANSKYNREFNFPIQNLISIAALLVWQPANPNDTITRILFPGSSPQKKIFEGLDRLKNLEFIKHPVCTEKSLVPASVAKKTVKDITIDKVIPKEKIPVERKENKIIENNVITAVNGEIKEKVVKKSDSTESDRSIKTKKIEEQKIIENGEKPKIKAKPPTRRSDSQQRKKAQEKKASPTTPKKSIVNGESKKPTKPSPISTPAKSAKDATNRRVIESKSKREAAAKPQPPAEPKAKIERKPISRRPKGAPKTPISPVKKVTNGVQKPDSISKKGKLDKEVTTDSSTVSTPSADQESAQKKDLSKLTTVEIEKLKAQELADLNEEQEAVKEIEAVFRKGEIRPVQDDTLRKIKEVSVDDKLEKEEYLIIEKEEIDHDSLDEKETKEDEIQKLARDSEESEKQRKLSSEENIAEEQEKSFEAEDIVKVKEEPLETSKVTSTEEKVDVSLTDKKTADKEAEDEVRDIAESQPDEKISANVKSGDTTTAPTLPEDERIPLDEIKEDVCRAIEEKHVKEETKEKDVPLIQLPQKSAESASKLSNVAGIRLDKQTHIRDIVKTPDEVADLPVHEEVDYEYTHELKAESIKTNEILEKRADDKIEETMEPVIYEKERVKLVEQEKDKDEVMQDVSEDIRKTSFTQEELKHLTDTVLRNESILETDILKDSEKTKVAALTDSSLDVQDTKIEDDKHICKTEDITIDESEKVVLKSEALEKSELEVKEKDDNMEKTMKSFVNGDVAESKPMEKQDEESPSKVETEDEKKLDIKFEEEPEISSATMTKKLEAGKPVLPQASEKDTEKHSDIQDSEKIEKNCVEIIELEKPIGKIEEGDIKHTDIPPGESKNKFKETYVVLKETDEIEDNIKDIPSVENVQTELTRINEEMLKSSKEDKKGLEKLEEKLQHLKDIASEIKTVDESKEPEVDVKIKIDELTKQVEPGVIENDVDSKTDIGEIKSEVRKEIKKSLTEEDPLLASELIEKMELGRKSPQERADDVIKIVASVAEVLKSDAPLEEFEGKLPISTYTPFSTSYTTELRETHITTVDSPTLEFKVIKTDTIPTIPEEPLSTCASFLEEERKITSVHEDDVKKPDDKRSSLLRESQELMMATSKMISDIKATKPEEKDDDEEGAVVHRMLVTASSEDGGEETEICPPGTITFPKSSESSGRSSPDQSQKISPKSSIIDTISDSLSTVKHVKELDAEKDSGIDDAKSEADQAAQETSPPPEEEIDKISKTIDRSSGLQKSEDALSGKSSPYKDASIKSLASGKSTPDISDFEKSKEIILSFDESRKPEDLLKKEVGVDLAKELSNAELETEKLADVEEEKVDKTNEEIFEQKSVMKLEEHRESETKPLGTKTSSLIETIEGSAVGALEAVSDLTKSLFKHEDESTKPKESVETKREKDDLPLETLQTAEKNVKQDSIVGKIADQIEDAIEKVSEFLQPDEDADSVQEKTEVRAEFSLPHEKDVSVKAATDEAEKTSEDINVKDSTKLLPEISTVETVSSITTSKDVLENGIDKTRTDDLVVELIDDTKDVECTKTIDDRGPLEMGIIKKHGDKSGDIRESVSEYAHLSSKEITDKQIEDVIKKVDTIKDISEDKIDETLKDVADEKIKSSDAVIEEKISSVLTPKHSLTEESELGMKDVKESAFKRLEDKISDTFETISKFILPSQSEKTEEKLLVEPESALEKTEETPETLDEKIKKEELPERADKPEDISKEFDVTSDEKSKITDSLIDTTATLISNDIIISKDIDETKKDLQDLVEVSPLKQTEDIAVLKETIKEEKQTGDSKGLQEEIGKKQTDEVYETKKDFGNKVEVPVLKPTEDITVIAEDIKEQKHTADSKVLQEEIEEKQYDQGVKEEIEKFTEVSKILTDAITEELPEVMSIKDATEKMDDKKEKRKESLVVTDKPEDVISREVDEIKKSFDDKVEVSPVKQTIKDAKAVETEKRLSDEAQVAKEEIEASIIEEPPEVISIEDASGKIVDTITKVESLVVTDKAEDSSRKSSDVSSDDSKIVISTIDETITSGLKDSPTVVSQAVEETKKDFTEKVEEPSLKTTDDTIVLKGEIKEEKQTEEIMEEKQTDETKTVKGDIGEFKEVSKEVTDTFVGDSPEVITLKDSPEKMDDKTKKIESLEVTDRSPEVIDTDISAIQDTKGKLEDTSLEISKPVKETPQDITEKADISLKQADVKEEKRIEIAQSKEESKLDDKIIEVVDRSERVADKSKKVESIDMPDKLEDMLKKSSEITKDKVELEGTPLVSSERVEETAKHLKDEVADLSSKKEIYEDEEPKEKAEDKIVELKEVSITVLDTDVSKKSSDITTHEPKLEDASLVASDKVEETTKDLKKEAIDSSKEQISESKGLKEETGEETGELREVSIKVPDRLIDGTSEMLAAKDDVAPDFKSKGSYVEVKEIKDESLDSAEIASQLEGEFDEKISQDIKVPDSPIITASIDKQSEAVEQTLPIKRVDETLEEISDTVDKTKDISRVFADKQALEDLTDKQIGKSEDAATKIIIETDVEKMQKVLKDQTEEILEKFDEVEEKPIVVDSATSIKEGLLGKLQDKNMEEKVEYESDKDKDVSEKLAKESKEITEIKDVIDKAEKASEDVSKTADIIIDATKTDDLATPATKEAADGTTDDSFDKTEGSQKVEEELKNVPNEASEKPLASKTGTTKEAYIEVVSETSLAKDLSSLGEEIKKETLDLLENAKITSQSGLLGDTAKLESTIVEETKKDFSDKTKDISIDIAKQTIEKTSDLIETLEEDKPSEVTLTTDRIAAEQLPLGVDILEKTVTAIPQEMYSKPMSQIPDSEKDKYGEDSELKKQTSKDEEVKTSEVIHDTAKDILECAEIHDEIPDSETTLKIKTTDEVAETSAKYTTKESTIEDEDSKLDIKEISDKAKIAVETADVVPDVQSLVNGSHDKPEEVTASKTLETKLEISKLEESVKDIIDDKCTEYEKDLKTEKEIEKDSNVETISRSTTKRKESIVEQLEEGISSTFSAISDFGKSLFRKGEKVIENSSVEVEQAKNEIAMTTKDVAEKVEEQLDVAMDIGKLVPEKCCELPKETVDSIKHDIKEVTQHSLLDKEIQDDFKEDNKEITATGNMADIDQSVLSDPRTSHKEFIEEGISAPKTDIHESESSEKSSPVSKDDKQEKPQDVVMVHDTIEKIDACEHKKDVKMDKEKQSVNGFEEDKRVLTIEEVQQKHDPMKHKESTGEYEPATEKHKKIKEEHKDSAVDLQSDIDEKCSDIRDGCTVYDIVDKKQHVEKTSPKAKPGGDIEITEKLPTEIETMDEKLMKKEQVLEETAKDLRETFETVADMSKSVVFDKCEKTTEKEATREEEKLLEKTAEDLNERFKSVAEMSKVLSFDKCGVSTDVGDIDPESLRIEEQILEKSAADVNETFQSVSKMSQSLSFDKCEKLHDKHVNEEEKYLKETAEDLKETFETLADMSKSVVFEKCETSERKKSIAEDLIGKVADDVKDAFEAVTDMSKSVIFEKCEKDGHSEKVDLEKAVKDEPSKDLKSDLDLMAKEIVEKTPKCAVEELKQCPEVLVTGDKQESICDHLHSVADMSTSIIFEKGEKETMEKTPAKSKDDERHSVIDVKDTASTQLQSTTSTDTELKQADSKETLPSTEKLQEGTALVVKETPKKLSISDVEVSLTDKTDIDKQEQKTESKDIDTDSCDKEKETGDIISSSLAGPSSTVKGLEDLGEVEKQMDLQEMLLHEKHIPGAVTPPTVPVSPNIIEPSQARREASETELGLRSPTPGSEDFEIISHSEISSSQMSKICLDSEKIDTDEEDDPLSVTSQVAHSRDSSSHHDFDEHTKKIDPMSMSLYGTLPVDSCEEKQLEPTCLYEITKAKFSATTSDKPYAKLDHSVNKPTEEGEMMSSSCIGELPTSSASQEKKDPIESWGKPLGLPAPPTYLYEITKAKYSSKKTIYFDEQDSENYLPRETEIPEDEGFDSYSNQHRHVDLMSTSVYGDLPTELSSDKDLISSWGKPLGLPSPAPPNDNKGTPKKDRKLPPNVTAKNKLNDDKKRAESPKLNKNKKINPVYVDLTYVPHHGNAYYSYVDFFKRVRARYYVFSGIEPSREVYNSLLEAKQTWEDKDLEVTIIPTYDTDILGYWVAENEELLTKFKIDLSPSASRCTINLQDHETSCSAYRLEF